MGGKGIGMGYSIYMYTFLHILIYYMGEGLSHVYTASLNYFLFYLLGYVQEDGFSSHGFILQHIYYLC